MSQPGRSWDDLRLRAITGVSLTLAGFAVVWFGGAAFALAAALVGGLIMWELAQMIEPGRRGEAMAVAALGGAALLLARALPADFIFPLLAAASLAGAGLIRKRKKIFAAFAFAVLTGCFALMWARDSYSALWVFWMILTVVMTDMAGYFGGRSIGGPKFWPAVSPKKTWAGIVSGWVAAVVVSLLFYVMTGSGAGVLWMAVPLSFASQMGDIAESALKRRLGAKDSSDLLPGHGGLFDRFDGVLGGALFLMAISLVIDLPGLLS